MTDATDFARVGTGDFLGSITRFFSGARGARGCFFTFHRVAAPDRWETLPNRGFYIDTDFLDRMLRFLATEGWDVVTMDEALVRTERDAPGDRFVNISIDDCYRDTYEELVPVFRRNGVPVTLHVTTGIPDGTLPMWGAGLEDVLLSRDLVRFGDEVVEVVTPEAKRQVFERIAPFWDGPQAGEHYARFCADNDVDMAAMHDKHAISWEMLRELSGDRHVEIGSHTINHCRISTLSRDDAFHELHGSRMRLEEVLGIAVRHFAFPYGRSGDCGKRDFDLTREAGYASAATTTKGRMRKGISAWELPRITINGNHRSLLAMRLHLTGATALAARVLRRV